MRSLKCTNDLRRPKRLNLFELFEKKTFKYDREVRKRTLIQNNLRPVNSEVTLKEKDQSYLKIRQTNVWL